MEVSVPADSEALWITTRRIAALAGPVILGELGWIAMSVVDTMMVGGMGPAAIGAIAVGSGVYYALAIFGVGLLFGLDTLVSQSFGAGELKDCHNSLMQGIYLALFLSVPLTLVFLVLPPVFNALGVVPVVSALAGHFLLSLAPSTFLLLLYSAFRRYLQGLGHVRPIMLTLVSANLINWFFNWLLINGHWGMPAWGVVGSGISTGVARGYMAVVLAYFVWHYEHALNPRARVLDTIARRPDWPRIRLLLTIGAPAASQILLEIGAFSVAGLLAGRISATALAAHQIALSCASVTYMVPLGTASAAAIAVGHAIGRGQPELARRSGFIATGLACVFMICAAIAFLVVPKQIIAIYTPTPTVVGIGTQLLALAAIFQLFDGIQTVTTGALRGLGETRIPMFVNFCGYWVIGLPLGYWLCFYTQGGVKGLWWGLTLALTLIATVLLYTWNRKSNTVVQRFS